MDENQWLTGVPSKGPITLKTADRVLRSLSNSPFIPKIVHQTWKTREVPEKWKSSYDAWTSEEMKQKGWTHYLWTDDDNRALIATHYSWFLEVYDGYKHPIQRADAVRPFILHRYGGVYCDLDIEPKVPDLDRWFESVKHHPVVLSAARSEHGMGSNHVTNAFMASVPGHEFWVTVWNFLLHPTRRTRAKGFLMKLDYHFDTLFRTGPGILTDASKEYGHARLYIAPSSILQPFENREDRQESVVKVLHGSSWHKDKKMNLYRAVRACSDHLYWIIGSVIVIVLTAFAMIVVLYRRCRRKSKDGLSCTRIKDVKKSVGAKINR